MLRTPPGRRRVRRLLPLALATGIVLATWPVAAPALAAVPTTPAPTPNPSAAPSSSVAQPPAATCPDARAELAAMNASRAWQLAGGRGHGAIVSVIGDAAKAAEARCSVLALAPDTTVRVFPVSGGAAGRAADVRSAASGGAAVVFADTSVDLADPALAQPLANAEAQGVVIVAATGDGLPAMPPRPSGIINVSAADLATHQLHSGSASGPTVTLAGYGADTATAAGYVAATATLLHAVHADWPVRQVAAQLAGSINATAGSPHDDRLGYGVLQPVQALSATQVDPAKLPGFAALFPVLPAAAASSGTASPGAAASQLAGASGSNPAPATGHAASKPSAGGGPSPLLLGGLGALLAAVALLVWQRRRPPAVTPLKPPEEWEPPAGQRHSGYGTPPE